jgi:hypothetical protein
MAVFLRPGGALGAGARCGGRGGNVFVALRAHARDGLARLAAHAILAGEHGSATVLFSAAAFLDTVRSRVWGETGPAANNLGRSAEYCRRSDPRDEATH